MLKRDAIKTSFKDGAISKHSAEGTINCLFQSVVEKREKEVMDRIHQLDNLIRIP